MRQLFGDLAAEHDNLLFDCEVEFSASGLDLPIVSGRWGTGKTARLLLRNADLSNVLAGLTSGDKSLDRIWLFNEQSIDSNMLGDEFDNAPNKNQFRQHLREFWKAEILRLTAIQLAILKQQYNVSGKHWTHIARFRSVSGEIGKSVWRQIPRLVGIVSKSADYQIAAESIHASIEEVFSDALLNNISRCLEDITKCSIKPVVCVEPIDTPTSKIENHTSLANDLVASLLDCFERNFVPSNRQLIEVHVSIPWHRVQSYDLFAPQKSTNRVAVLRWYPKELKAFINRRIEYEFRLLNRKFKGDCWSTLFAQTVRNPICNPPVDENSFDFLVRHTQYRPRDIQVLAQRAVQNCAIGTNLTVDDILRGKSGIIVDAKYILQAVEQTARQNTENRIIEAARVFPRFREVADCLKGVSIPFSSEHLKKRVASIEIDFVTAMDQLWQSGLVGIQAEWHGKIGTATFLPESNRAAVKNIYGQESYRYFFFCYNCDYSPSELLSNLQGAKDVNAGMVLHPHTYEYFLPGSIPSTHPIGL